MNFIPNSNFQLTSQFSAPNSVTSAMRESGEALQSQVNVLSFDTSSNYPTLYTPNTGELYNGAMIVMGMGHAGLSGWALRVSNLVPNVSFKVKLPFSAMTAPVSTPQTAFAAGICSLWAANANMGPDGGWNCAPSPSLVWWVDKFASNLCPGSKQVIGLRKTISTPEDFQWSCPAEILPQLRGRPITIGALIRQKKQQGVGTARFYINDHINAPAFSSDITGVSYTHPVYGPCEFIKTSIIPDRNCTSLDWGIETHGAAGDVYYIGTPTGKFGSCMTVDDLGQEQGEHIIADTHWNPPCMVPLSGNFPGAPMINDLIGWTDIDMEGLSYCQAHGSLRKINGKIEVTSSRAGMKVFVGALDIPNIRLTFGLQAEIQVANVGQSTNASMIPLKRGMAGTGAAPGCMALFSNVVSGPFSNMTFDFDDVMA